MFEVEVRNLPGASTAIGSAPPFTLVVDRPRESGGGGLGFNGGELLYLAVAGCVSNDLFREAAKDGISLEHVVVRVRGEFGGDPAVSGDVEYDVQVSGEPRGRLEELVRRVDAIAEIPNSLRGGTAVRLGRVDVGT